MRRFALIVAAALLAAGLVWLEPFHAKSPQIAVGDTAALKPEQVELINKEGEASMTSPPQTFVIS